MGNIQTEISRVSGNISAALSALTDKGVSVPSGANSDDLATLIAAIEAGGGGGGTSGILMAGGSITPTAATNELVLNHGLGVVPNFLYGVTTSCNSQHKGRIKSFFVSPEPKDFYSAITSFVGITQTQAYYQNRSYYRVNFTTLSTSPTGAVTKNPYCVVDSEKATVYGTNYDGYTDYSQFDTVEYRWIAIYNPNIEYWSDFA